MNTKAFRLELKDIGPDGVFSGVASVYGNVDLGGDAVQRGAFTKTLAERGTQVPILWQHDQTTPIGLGTLTDSADGLLITGKLSLGTTKGREAYELLKDGVVKGLSIGYEVVKQGFVGGVRHLKELKIYEVSTVTFPMNESATVTDVKQGRRNSAADAATLGEVGDLLDQARDKVSSLVDDDHEEIAKAFRASIRTLKGLTRPAPRTRADIAARMRANERKLRDLVGGSL